MTVPIATSGSAEIDGRTASAARDCRRDCMAILTCSFELESGRGVKVVSQRSTSE